MRAAESVAAVEWMTLLTPPCGPWQFSHWMPARSARSFGLWMLSSADQLPALFDAG